MRCLPGQLATVCSLGTILLATVFSLNTSAAKVPKAGNDSTKARTSQSFASELPEIQPIPEFVNKGIEWLVESQHESGGWGAGSHANQQNRESSKVKVDPATTAFTASALLRAGHTPTAGQYRDAVRHATRYLVDVVLAFDREGPKITEITGTQIQAKLGPLVDTVMTTQYLARVLTLLPENDKLSSQVRSALDRCVTKLEQSQNNDGSWNLGGGWAPVLQSSLATNSLELAQVAGGKVDERRLASARGALKSNFNRNTGDVDAKAGAGVKLYAFGAAQRASSAEARAANDLIDEAKLAGKLDATAKVTVDNLREIGVEQPKAKTLVEADQDIRQQNQRLNDEALLRGFGTKGGEEYLSYMLSSESLVITSQNGWVKWRDKMHRRLAKSQQNDGSWTGHHCITSPVFCTAAVAQCLTADRDGEILLKIARQEAKIAQAVVTVNSRNESK